LSEVVFPGWTASVDGREVSIARADGLFRAVWLEAGPHQVAFVYRPRSFSIGLALSVLGALAWAAAARLEAVEYVIRMITYPR